MSVTIPIPVRASVRDLLSDLLARPVQVTAGTPPALDAQGSAWAATYVRDDGVAAAVCVCDTPLAVSSGAAIGMVPAATAADEAATGELTGDTLEFFREVVNVLAKLLNSPASPHVRLGTLYSLPGEVPGDVASIVLHPRHRTDFDVDVDGYGRGSMTVLVA